MDSYSFTSGIHWNYIQNTYKEYCFIDTDNTAVYVQGQGFEKTVCIQ